MEEEEGQKNMLSSSSHTKMRMEGPPVRPVRQRSIKLCCSSCLVSEDDDSNSQGQGRSWLMKGSGKSGHYQSTNDEDDISESWWQKGWTNSVKKAGDQWSNLMEEAGGKKWRWRWRWGNKWLKREPCMISSIICSRKTVHCNYDELSYAQNFDEGDWQEEDVYPCRAFSARFAAPSFQLPKPTEV